MFVELLTSVSFTSWCVLLALLLLLMWKLMSPSHPNLPPSPGRALPILGHVHLMSANPRIQFRQFKEKLGDVFSLRLGSTTVIVLNGYHTVKEALVKQADKFSDRPTNYYVAKRIPYVLHGISMAVGHNWKSQRTTSVNILRSFGVGKNILGEKVAEEVAIFVKELKKSKGEPLDIRNLIKVSVSNVICSIIFGQRFEFDDPTFIRMMALIDEPVKLGQRTAILNYFPWLEHLPFDPFKSQELVDKYKELQTFLREIVDNKLKSYDPDNLDNFITAYWDEMKKNEKKGIKTHLNEVDLVRIIDDLFFAGTETSSSTVLWVFLYCLHYPHVQEKIYREIVREVGTERPPNMLDNPKLKYLNAAIMEIQRVVSIVPLSVFHKCNQDTTINGYHIPKDAIVLPSLDSILLDKKLWGDPEVFRPERFLDEEGNLVRREELVPFSMGQRRCPGDNLAKMELFLYLSSLFQNFKFLPLILITCLLLNGCSEVFAPPRTVSCEVCTQSLHLMVNFLSSLLVFFFFVHITIVRSMKALSSLRMITLAS